MVREKKNDSGLKRRLQIKPLQIIKIILALLGCVLQVVSWMAYSNIELKTIAQFSVGVFFLVLGIDEFRLKHKLVGVFSIGVALFGFFEALYKYMFR